MPVQEGVYSLNEVGDQYRRFRGDKDGAAAVGGARSSYSLKSANSPADAIQLGREEALRGTLSSAPAPFSAPQTTAPSGSKVGPDLSLNRSAGSNNRYYSPTA